MLDILGSLVKALNQTIAKVKQLSHATIVSTC
jgi:hypothetical protein